MQILACFILGLLECSNAVVLKLVELCLNFAGLLNDDLVNIVYLAANFIDLRAALV